MNSDSANNATIHVDMYRNAARVNPAEGYKGLRIHALQGLHEFTAERVYTHSLAGGSVLDLGAGSGAMSQRLVDAGFEVTATDYVIDNFRLHSSVRFFQSDLNEHFSTGRESAFDTIVASEIIEHLENPRNFMRECFATLKPGGTLVISTPNLDNAASIAGFIVSNKFQWFGELEYERDGHLTPLTQWQIGKCAAESGFQVVEHASFGDPYGTVRGSLRMLMLSMIIAFLRPRNNLSRQIYVGVFRKSIT